MPGQTLDDLTDEQLALYYLAYPAQREAVFAIMDGRGKASMCVITQPPVGTTLEEILAANAAQGEALRQIENALRPVVVEKSVTQS